MIQVRPVKRESNAINRVLKAWGLPPLGSVGVVPALARMVVDHQHFGEMLRACEPALRREMYEAMRPHLLFPAKPLEDYIIAAKEHAEAAQLPTTDEQGHLHPYSPGIVGAGEAPKVKLVTLAVQCARCQAWVNFSGPRTVDAIATMREAGWTYDESQRQRHLCPLCLEDLSPGHAGR